ncbi:MAG: type II toxin-antitoxin system RelE/ParE family toxin [Nitrospirae bacterium]|nr:MAG: type II toxin-antitoxin system RelE/ParE family toxin [Nitrospirota bacterium]
MRIAWLREAVQDLVEIRRFIATDNPDAAMQVAKRILDTVTYLRDHPEIGRIGRIPGTRELVIPGLPYIVPYRVKGASIEILGVLHASQAWPKAL